MNVFRLTKPVSITGPNFFGRKAVITFSPSEAEGWWWKTRNGTVRISPGLLTRKFRRTALCSDGQTFNVFEHIGFFRYLGLLDVVIETPAWPPHLGSALPMWEQLRPHCFVDSVSSPRWYTLVEPVKYEYKKARVGFDAYTRIYPSKEPGLRLNVSYYHKGFRYERLFVSLLDNRAAEEIGRHPSQGVGWFYKILRVTSRLGLFPPKGSVTWPQGMWIAEASRRFLLHRIADLIGTLSLLCQDGLFAADVESQCAGHEADVSCVLQAQSRLIKLEEAGKTPAPYREKRRRSGWGFSS